MSSPLEKHVGDDDGGGTASLLSSAFAPIPKNETEAKETFRQEPIDKAHGASAISWPEHVDNFHHSLASNDITSSRSFSLRNNNGNRNHHVTGISTLRKRRRSKNSTASASSGKSSNSTTLGGGGGDGVSTSSIGGGVGPSSVAFSVMTNSSNSIRSIIMESQELGGIQDSKIDEEYDDDIETVLDVAAADAAVDIIPEQKDEQDSGVDGTEAPPGEANTGVVNKSSTSIPTVTKKTRKSKPNPKAVPMWEKYYNRHIQLLVSLALFSYLGEYLRYVTEYFFGGACHHTNTTYWDATGLNICTTDFGTGLGTGGGFFLDLPANVIGCFMMGLLVSGDGESIAINLPVAALSRESKFQNWIVTHVGLRTGLCGSLTTFASWNTQMVIMICGGSGTELGYSQWMSSIWGYIIGLFAALQSYQFGVAVAYALSRKFNPHLAMEADLIVDKRSIGVLTNRDLPDFERRFLHSIVLNEDEAAAEVEQVTRKEGEGEGEEEAQEGAQAETKENLHKYGDTHESYYDNHIHHLRVWKHSTDDHRGGKKKENTTTTTTNTITNTENYVQELQEIEKNLLVDRIEPRQELLDIARDAGWDVGALRNWTTQLDNEEKKRIINEIGGSRADTGLEEQIEDAYYSYSSGNSTSPLWEVSFNLTLFLVCTALLLYGFMYFKGKTDSVSTNTRGQFLAALLSPFGTYSRWYLSRLNGSIRSKYWEWLPIGTFLANMIASIISALCAAFTLKVPDDQYLANAFLGAIKTGYAGSMSTVSTFVAEITGLSRALPRYFWSFYYGFGSIFIALILGVCSYVWAVV